MRYLLYILSLFFATAPQLSLLAQSGPAAAHSEANSASGSVSATFGQVFYITLDACGGIAQPGVQQPEFPVLNRQSILSATDTSDAYITLSWEVLEECFKNVDNRCMPYPDGVLIELLAEGERIYSTIVYNADGLLTDSYRHFVGPDTTVNYTLNLFIRGAGNMACTSLTATGSTLPFQPPTNFVAAQGTDPGRIALSWVNNSQLSTTFLLFRLDANGDSLLIASVPGTETVDTTIAFVDAFALGDSLNFVNGQVYEYCLRTFNDPLDRILPDVVCTTGSSFPIGLTATLTGSDRVDLAWSDVSAFAQQLRVLRNGLPIAQLPAGQTASVDNDPTYGRISTYTLELLDSLGASTARASDTVFVPAIGQLAGYVRTPQQVGIVGIPVTYTARVDEDTIRATVLTDHTGRYSFDNVYYGRRALFSLRAQDQGRFTFPNLAQRDSLNNLKPRSTQLDFTSIEEYPISLAASLTIDTVETEARIDELAFTWTHSQMGDLGDTLYFQLYREGELLTITDDAQAPPLELLDRSAAPNYIYQYRVVAYGFKEDSLVRATYMLFDTMPGAEQPYDFIAVNNFDAQSNNTITLAWNHDSDNFDGFRLYRDGLPIATLPPDARSFYDYYAEPGMAFSYELTAFRLSGPDMEALESPPASAGPVGIPTLPSAQNLQVQPLPLCNAMELTWSLPAAADQYDNLSGFVVYRDGQPLKRVLKRGQDYLFRDHQGRPGQAVAYTVTPYLAVPDTAYLGTAQQAMGNYPAIAMPALANATPVAGGYLSIGIDPAYTQQHCNFDGFVLYANGQPFDTLAPYQAQSFYTPNLAGGQAGVSIELRAFRAFGNGYAFSDPASATASVGAQAASILEAPTNFQASSHIPMHVALRWDYPDYIFASFVVYRDGQLLEELPTGARYYYDREATVGQLHRYTLQARYQGNNSTLVQASGIRKGRTFLQGQLLSQGGYTADWQGVAVDLRNSADSTFLLRTFTDSAGYFRFDRLHPLVGTGNWQVTVDAQGGGHLMGTQNRSTSGRQGDRVFFQDQFPVAATPPLPYRDSIARLQSLELNAFPDEQAIVATWSFSEGQINGNELRRGLTELAAVPLGAPTFFLDSLGSSQIEYPYQGIPYLTVGGTRSLQAAERSRAVIGAFPELKPVEYLSGLPGLNNLDNSVTLQWSHATGKVNYYEIQRNNLPVAQVSAQDILSFVDVTGKPNQRYIYQVRAVRSSSTGLTFSAPRTVEVVFPEIARPLPFEAMPLPDSNAVLLTWDYRGDAVDGFRIFRNDHAIATLAGTDREYYDFNGVPFSATEYKIVALLNREGMNLQSRSSIAEADYPALLPPYQVQATTQTAKGNIEISFRYRARGVNEFRVDRVGPASSKTTLGRVSYAYSGAEQSFIFPDVDGLPGQSYTYEVVALTTRDGITYSSAPGSATASYPMPPTPAPFFASTDFSNWIDLGWSLPLDANVDGFLIFRDNLSPVLRDTFQIVNAGKRTYRDVYFTLTGLPVNGMNYELAAYREVNGQFYLSLNNPKASGRVANPGAATQLSSVVASKGTFANRTRIAWIYAGDISLVNEFKVYRDDELFATVQPNISFVNDSDGVPGREYVYTVTATLSNAEDQGLSDIGFTRGAGQFEGEVVTLQGSAPVEGAKLLAEAIVEGELYRYEVLTNNSGQFLLDGLYIGEGPADYRLSVSYLDHGFLEPVQNITLSPQNATKANLFFFDTTAFAVTGLVSYAGIDCTLDSIRVVARHFLSDGSSFEEVTQTDQNGRYSLILRTNQAGLQRISIEIDSLFIRDQGTQNEQAILHRFQPLGSTEISLPAPRLTALNFVDTLTYPVEISVRNVCGFAASSNGRFTIEVNNEDGCFLLTQQTNLAGTAVLHLPPLEGLSARVVTAAPLSLENNLIVNYLEYRPTGLDLATLHIENGRFDAQGRFGLERPDTTVERTLVYHRPAAITLATEFGMRPSCDASQPRVIEQGETYPLGFRITENHQGVNCDVNEGYLIINNSAAVEQRVQIDYDSTINGFPPYEFVAGTPNLVFPYRKGINIQYFSSIGDLLSERTIPVVVLGLDALPGSDIITNPTDEEGILKFPVFILRDPPGDGSYSYIEEGQTVNKSISNIFSIRAGIGAVTELKIAAKVGIFVDASLIGGGGVDREGKREISFTTQQRIETSSTSDFVGPDADVLAGVGISTQYGITELIEFDEATCAFRKRQQIDIAPEGIETDWLFTVGQIKQIVREKRNDIEAVRAGTKTIVKGGEVQPSAFAIKELEAEAFNWEEVLRYHQLTTVPYYQFCADELNNITVPATALFPENFLVPVVRAAINSARAPFCAEIGVLPGDNTKTAEEVRNIIFTSSLQESYEQAVQAVDAILAPFSFRDLDFDPGEAPFREVSNTTFSAGVTIEKAETLNRGSSTLIQPRGFVDLSVAVGALQIEGISAGFGVFNELFKADSKIGGIFTLNTEFGEDFFDEITRTYTVGYVLSDDDPGDQFSVTAIKPRTTGHTPYFQLLGGRSSCPPEVGTILRDRFDISLYDPETQATFDFQELRALDPNEPAIFYLQLTNLNPFGEQRDFFVYHEAESNENGAALRLNGLPLGGGNETGQTLTFINPNQPVIIPLELNRSVNNYQFDSIFVVLRPSCTDGDLFLLGTRDTVTISAFFQHPCSDITIAAPGNDWLIRRRNPFMADSREVIVIQLRDYEADNPQLEELYLEYRRIGDGSNWRKVPRSQLDPGYRLSADSLAAFNAANFGPGQAPQLPIAWDITELYNQYPDGIYEIRAVAFCGTTGVIQSNIIRGQIRRQTGDVFALTEPGDGIWQQGDEISIRVNKELDCNRTAEITFQVVDKGTGLPVPGNVACFPNQDKLIFSPTDPSLLAYDGRLLQATVYDLVDEPGNRYPDTFRWEFRVIARDLYVQDTLLETTIYQDSEGFLSTTLFNTNTGGLIDFSIPNLGDYPWLEIAPTAGVISTAEGRRVTFTVDGSMLPVGDTTAVVVFASGSGLPNAGMDTVRIRVNVLARPPYWVVDPSQYTTSMPFIGNYQFVNAPGITSRDSMDIVSAWIGNEIRGVARIAGTPAGQYAAYMLIYGDNPDDQNKPLSFRVWDASEGIEYNARPTSMDTLRFNDAVSIGTFRDPEILSVDRSRDRARYIPLNGEEDGGGRLTWFSVNSREPDMSVDAQLRELKFLRNGDVIKTAASSAGYVEGLGWISTNGLDSLRPEEGYIISLAGLDDTIRVTGRDAMYGPIVLAQGWNLIGYPLQDTLGINAALDGLLGPSNNDLIRTVAQDPSLPGLSINMLSQYDNGVGEWLFGIGSGMEVMRPNFAYQLRVGQATTLLYPGATPFSGGSTSLRQSGSAPPKAAFSPSDPSTWTVDPSAYPSSMIVTGTVSFDGELSADSGDLVAAFVNGECRGVSPIYEISALGSHLATLFVYGAQPGEEVQILLYRASEDQVYLHRERLPFEPNGLTGSFGSPYAFENQAMGAVYETAHVYCEADSSGSLSATMVSGLEPPYAYTWSTGEAGPALSGLPAGWYHLTVTGGMGLAYQDSVEVKNLNVEIPAPELVLPASPVCLGSDLLLQATPPNEGATVYWATAEGEWLQDGPALLVENLQEDYLAYAYTLYRGCESAGAEASVTAYEPDADFSYQPAQDVQVGMQVQFEPAEALESQSYQWSFGDGLWSTEARPEHAYSLPGVYGVELQLTDSAGCTAQRASDIWVEALSRSLSLDAGLLRLEAWPNPFSYRLEASVELPVAGAYRLSLFNAAGQEVWSQGYDWAAGKQSVSVESRAPDGLYLLRLDDGQGHRLALPLIKQSIRP